ncbi:MAG TPA: HD domain-containing phosphohydrolase [Thermoleophilaceae bacterium]|jgi:diguanylate cyclase (GGDEF)-like protein
MELGEVRAQAAADRLLEDSWDTRSRRLTLRELAAEAAAAALFLACAAGLALAATPAGGFDVPLAALLVALYALVSRIEFPVGAGYVVPSYLVLVPMFVMLPPAVVPLLTVLGLVIGTVGQWLVSRSRPERVLFSIPNAWHAIGPAVVLVIAGPVQGTAEATALFLAAFLAACAVDLVSATLREAAALGVAPQLQLRVLAQVWVVDACLAPVGLLAAQAAAVSPERLLLILPLGGLLLWLARDRSARIVQAQQRLEQASTDPLTGLGNRRLLATDLTTRLRTATIQSPAVLMLFDLDGFKRYNDTFGHPAGDALLALLGGKLAAAVGSHGTAYRLGGDEFCVLVDAGQERLEELLASAAHALTEAGEEFTVRPSYGAVLLPHEASDAEYALQLADQRMYGRKHGRATGPREQARDVLMGSMQACEPSLHEHATDVAELAIRTGRRLGMSGEELDIVARAAELHDVGKVAVPDAILNKPGQLDATEWEFMRQHTVLGERILSAAPALRPVARIVRWSHERWDGRGYPDGLEQDDIPLSARIVAVCDAFDAMTSDRAYRAALELEEARAELQRESGRQFDPAVVEAFLHEIHIARGRLQDWTGAEAHELDEVAKHLREVLAAATGTLAPRRAASAAA